MTSPRYSAGTAFLDVIPSFRGVQRAIAKEVRAMEGALGKDAGEEFGKNFEKSAQKKVDDVLKTSKAKDSGKKAGEDYASGFNESLNRSMQDAAKSLRNTKLGIDLDDGKAQSKLKALQFQLDRLGKAKIGVDMDAGQAIILIGRLQESLRTLQDKTINIDARVELGRAEAQLAAFRKSVEKDAKFEIEPEFSDRSLGLFEKAVRARLEAALKNFPPVEFDADVTPAQAKLMELRQRMIELGDKHIGVDIDASAALAEMEGLRRELATIANDESIDVQVRTDAAGAAAELLEIRKLAKVVDDTKVEINVKLDDNGIRSRLQALRDQTLGTGDGGQTAANSFRAFNGVILAAVTLLPAVVPLLGAAAGGLALFGAQAVGVAGGIGVLLFAFQGIGDAVKALGKAQNDAGKDAEASAKKMRAASQSVEDAQRSVSRAEDDASRAGVQAQRAVTDARENAAEAAKRAARDVSDARENEARVQDETSRSIQSAIDNQRDAELALGDAQERVTDAQLDLTQARKDAQEQQEDALLSLRDSKLDAEKAQIDLLKAQKVLRDVLASGQGSLSDEDWSIKLRSAQYDVNKYALAIDSANERTGDLTEQTAEFAKTGVEGSKQVQDAQKKVQDAEEDRAKAQTRLADAQAAVVLATQDAERSRTQAARATQDAVDAQQKAERDGARAIADAVEAQKQQQIDSANSVGDAQRNLSQAQQAYSDALYETGVTGSASMQAVNQAMGALGPEGQEFARFINSLRGEFQQLRDLAQAGVLPGVQDAITAILRENGPMLATFVSTMGQALGDIFRQLGQLMTSDQWKGIFATFVQYAPIFMQQAASVGFAALTFFGELFQGLAPYAATFGDAVVAVADGMARWMASFTEGQTFQAFMAWFFTEGPKIWDTLLNVGRAIGAILIALAPLGEVVLAIIDQVAKWIAGMDPRLLGTIVTVLLGLVGTFQVLSAAVTIFALSLDAALLPFTGWILVIGAVITAIIALYTQSETFRTIVDAVLKFVGAAIKVFWEYTVWAWQQVAAGLEWLGGVFSTIFSAIATAAEWLWDHGLRQTFDAIAAGWSALMTGIQWVWDNILHPVFDAIMRVAEIWFAFLTVVILGPLAAAWWLMTQGIQLAWDTVLHPLLDFIGVVFETLWKSVLRPLFDLMLAGWQVLLGALKLAYDTVLHPMIDAMAAVFGWLWDKILSPIFGWISDRWAEVSAGFRIVYDRYIQPMVDVMQAAFGGLRDFLRDAITAMGTYWDSLRALAAKPINFLIKTVLRDGLVKAFNWVTDTLKLPFHIDEKASWLQGIAGYAAGGPTVMDQRRGGKVNGPWVSDTADNVIARLNPGEHVQPVKRVRQYGMDLFEAFRAGQIDPRAARQLLTPGYADGGPVYQQIFSSVKKRFPTARMNDGFRPGAADLHGQGLAVDLGETGFAGGNGRPLLAAMNRDLYDRAGKYIAELIYDGAGDDRPDLKNGKPLNYGASTSAAHHNHVHLGVRDLAGFLSAYGSGGGGIGGMIDAASNLLGGIWDSVTGVFGSIKDSITAPLQSLTSQFGDGFLTKMPGEAVKQLPGQMWDVIKDKVGGLAGDIWDGAKDAASWVSGKASGAFNWVVDKITGGSVQDTVRSAAKQRGWDSGAQWEALSWIINHESGWNPNAQNKSSTAYGLFQFLNSTWASTGIAKTSDPAKQAQAGMNYIGDRYKTPVAAKAFWQANGWYSEGGPVSAAGSKADAVPTLYDTGGSLPPGLTTVLNASKKPEQILTSSQWDDLVTGRGGEESSVIGELHLHEVQYNPEESIGAVNHWARVYRNGGRYTGGPN